MAWPEVVIAISTAIIAIVLVAAGVGAIMAMRELREVRALVERGVNLLELEAKPALVSARSMVADAQQVVAAIRSEAGGITELSKEVRGKVQRLVDRTEDRLKDLEALVDIVQYEVEETALDVTAALRTTRRSASILRAMKHAFLGRGR